MNIQAERQEFHPELVSRRSELIAWGSALLVDGVWILLILTGQLSSFWLPLLGVPLILIALGISLANWMDRHTIIKLDEQRISFSNGLRHTLLQWNDIQQVRVLPAQWGKKVQVFGERSYFGFHTLGEVFAYGKPLGRTGFVEGDFILQVILDKADLSAVNQINVEGRQEGYYYSRK
jgi:hypothetical protein